MIKNRASKIKYLLRETRYTIEELNKFTDQTIQKFYTEEKECNKAEY